MIVLSRMDKYYKNDESKISYEVLFSIANQAFASRTKHGIVTSLANYKWKSSSKNTKKKLEDLFDFDTLLQIYGFQDLKHLLYFDCKKKIKIEWFDTLFFYFYSSQKHFPNITILLKDLDLKYNYGLFEIYLLAMICKEAFNQQMQVVEMIEMLQKKVKSFLLIY